MHIWCTTWYVTIGDERILLLIHTGQVVAGIVGTKKFHYDVWGDTVNVANRMEATCDVGRVNISESTFALLNKLSLFNFENRGKVKVKGKQDKIAMYYVSRSSVTNQAV